MANGPESEDRRKHLEMIQAIISRMANTSFLLKGWSVTLLAALFALSSNDSDRRFVFFGLISVPAFWGLDAYYLRQERLFRKLYDAIRALQSATDFTMDTTPHDKGNDARWRCALFSQTMWPFHLTVLAATIFVSLLAFFSDAKSEQTKIDVACCCPDAGYVRYKDAPDGGSLGLSALDSGIDESAVAKSNIVGASTQDATTSLTKDSTGTKRQRAPAQKVNAER